MEIENREYQMKELTLGQKIDFCKYYLQTAGMNNQEAYICNRFKMWYDSFIKFTEIWRNSFPEEVIIVLFPELYAMIMKVGQEINFENFTYTYYMSWCDGNDFRKEKVGELLNQLQNK